MFFPVGHDQFPTVYPSAEPRPVCGEREEKPSQYQPHTEYDNYDDFEKIYMRRPLEISLRMSIGAKKEGMYSILYIFWTFKLP